MHGRHFATAFLAVLALLLSACATASGSSGTGNALLPTVTGEFGDRPALEFPDGEPSTALETSVLSEGDGGEVEAGDLLVVHYLGQVWGGAIFDNSYDRGATSSFLIGVGRTIDGWDQGLVGQQVGSRVLLTIPPELGYGPDGNERAGIKGTDTMAFVVDIYAAYGPEQAGSADATPTSEAATVGPKAEGDLGSPAAVSVPDGLAEPTELTTTVLARADGEPAVAGTLVLQYAATYWDNSAGESTWELGQPLAAPVGSGGAFDELVGIPIGSRVLIEIPANADQELPAIALVVDILGQENNG